MAFRNPRRRWTGRRRCPSARARPARSAVERWRPGANRRSSANYGRREASNLGPTLNDRSTFRNPSGACGERDERQAAAARVYCDLPPNPIAESSAMTMSVHQYLCLTDNYGALIHDSTTGATACVDAPEAGPTFAALEERGWTLSDVLLTHHHADHIQGVPELKAKFPNAQGVGTGQGCGADSVSRPTGGRRRLRRASARSRRK